MKFGADHPATLAPTNEYAVLRREQQCYEEVESLLRQTLDDRQRELGPDQRHALESRHELAVYIRQAPCEDAEPLLLEAFDGHEAKLGPEHLHTIESLNQLVSLYESRNRPERAAWWRAKQSANRSDP